MKIISDLQRLERELRDAVASDGLKEPNQACDAAVKLTNALPRSAGGSSKDGEFFQTEKLLSYLSDERDVSGRAVKQNKPNGLRLKGGKGDDAEARRIVRLILAERSAERSATSSEECCADLVGALAGDSLFEAKPWVGSSSDSATHMDKVQQTLLNTVRKRLPRLIAEKVRAKASKDVTVVCPSSSSPPEGEYGQLARSLQKRVETTMRLDAEDASCFVDVAKLEAKFEAYAAIARHLLAQNARLRRVAAADKLHASHLENVASGLSVVHDSLASRLEQCSSLVAATTSAALDTTIVPQGTEAHSADLIAMHHESAFDELCTERLRTAIARTEAVGKLEEEQEKIEELADALSAELNEACQGSVKTWCMNQASLVKPDRVCAMTRELFREFHEDPERFLRRVHSAQKGAGRDA